MRKFLHVYDRGMAWPTLRAPQPGGGAPQSLERARRSDLPRRSEQPEDLSSIFFPRAPAVAYPASLLATPLLREDVCVVRHTSTAGCIPGASPLRNHHHCGNHPTASVAFDPGSKPLERAQPRLATGLNNCPLSDNVPQANKLHCERPQRVKHFPNESPYTLKCLGLYMEEYQTFRGFWVVSG